MDLVAGDARDIVLALSIDDVAAFDDPDRFVAHLPLGGGLDPTWLDLFSEAVRSVTGGDEPSDFLDARSELEGATTSSGSWIASTRTGSRWSASLPDDQARSARRTLDRAARGGARAPAAGGEALDPRSRRADRGLLARRRRRRATSSSPGPSERRSTRGRTAPPRERLRPCPSGEPAASCPHEPPEPRACPVPPACRSPARRWRPGPQPSPGCVGGFKALNRWFMIPVHRAGLGAWLSTPIGGYMLLLRVRGRTTGLIRETPLSYLVAEGVGVGDGGVRPPDRVVPEPAGRPARGGVDAGRSPPRHRRGGARPAVRARILPALARATGGPSLMVGVNPWTAPDAGDPRGPGLGPPGPDPAGRRTAGGRPGRPRWTGVDLAPVARAGRLLARLEDRPRRPPSADRDRLEPGTMAACPPLTPRPPNGTPRSARSGPRPLPS